MYKKRLKNYEELYFSIIFGLANDNDCKLYVKNIKSVTNNLQNQNKSKYIKKNYKTKIRPQYINKIDKETLLQLDSIFLGKENEILNPTLFRKKQETQEKFPQNSINSFIKNLNDFEDYIYFKISSNNLQEIENFSGLIEQLLCNKFEYKINSKLGFYIGIILYFKNNETEFVKDFLINEYLQITLKLIRNLKSSCSLLYVDNKIKINSIMQKINNTQKQTIWYILLRLIIFINHCENVKWLQGKRPFIISETLFFYDNKEIFFQYGYDNYLKNIFNYLYKHEKINSETLFEVNNKISRQFIEKFQFNNEQFFNQEIQLTISFFDFLFEKENNTYISLFLAKNIDIISKFVKLLFYSKQEHIISDLLIFSLVNLSTKNSYKKLIQDLFIQIKSFLVDIYNEKTPPINPNLKYSIILFFFNHDKYEFEKSINKIQILNYKNNNSLFINQLIFCFLNSILRAKVLKKENVFSQQIFQIFDVLEKLEPSLKQEIKENVSNIFKSLKMHESTNLFKVNKIIKSVDVDSKAIFPLEKIFNEQHMLLFFQFTLNSFLNHKPLERKENYVIKINEDIYYELIGISFKYTTTLTKEETYVYNKYTCKWFSLINNRDKSHSKLNDIINNNIHKITIIYSQQNKTKLPKIVDLYGISQDNRNRNLSGCKIDYSSSVYWFARINFMLYEKYKSTFNLFSTEEIQPPENIFDDED